MSGQVRTSVQRQPSGFTYELRDENQAEANVVVAVVRCVPVAVRHPAVDRVVVPATAANNAVRTLDVRPCFQIPIEACTFCLNVFASACSVKAVSGVAWF